MEIFSQVGQGADQQDSKTMILEDFSKLNDSMTMSLLMVEGLN